MTQAPPRTPLFPYTTLFRSTAERRGHLRIARHIVHVDEVLLRLLAQEVLVEQARGVRVRGAARHRSEEHTSELQSLAYLVCRLLLEKKMKKTTITSINRQTI